MTPVLVDTSVWIDAFNGKVNKHTKRLKALLEKDAPVVICPIILQEILQGIRNDAEHASVKESLLGFEMLFIDPTEVAIGASELYRTLRKRGVTIRKSNDCAIAFYAIRNNIPLLHNDADFNRIGKHAKLKLIE